MLQEHFMGNMTTSARKDLSKTVGEYATPIEVHLSIEFTIEDAMHYLRKKHLAERIIYFYVVDEDGKLCGVINTRTLLLRDPSTPIAEVMQPKVICLHKNQTLQESLEVLQSHRLLALPVIDEDKRLIGMIDVDLYLEESGDVAIARRRSDVFQLIGVYLEEDRHPSAMKSYCKRMPWIFCNIVGGIVCAIISHYNEAVLGKFLLLAMFIPLILTLSESISMQSMTQSLQVLHNKNVKLRFLIAMVFRETKTVVMIGITCGLIVGCVSLLWKDGLMAGITIAIGIILGTFVTATIGSITPIILHLRKWDPKVASGPVVLMFADVLTTAIYLYLASALLL
jgi:magnesium transporter